MLGGEVRGRGVGVGETFGPVGDVRRLKPGNASGQALLE